MSSTSNSKSAFARRLKQPGLISAPGVFDMISARIADSMGFDVLYMTGYAEKAAGPSFLEQGAEIITKPFDMDVLATRIREIIESR